MYFKQLELVGFKSFPLKTKLKFEPGVTAVVGPNGCGKSNVADAIRWVLGEQSAKTLRGSSMEDVIFNGTASMEPINMAEVSLTLSNEDRALPIDYDEITITRRLFRSGESEYILNKTPVRLKDITNILMGTGIGTSSYSIIEQGKIGLILSSRPEDRRYIFEEASGITRYKTKKKEALRKLEHTENNLVRIGDIINEVRRQINSIERHAKKAEKYKKDFEIMKGLDLKLGRHELNNINSTLEKNNEILEGAGREEKTLKAEFDGNMASINKYRDDLGAIIYELTDMQKKLSESTLFIDKARHDIELNRERINDSVNFKAQSEEELGRAEEKLKVQEEEIARIKERFDNMARTKKEKGSALAQKEASLERLSHEIESHQKDIKEAKARTLNTLAVKTKAKNESIKLGADLTNRKARLRRLEAEKKNTEEEKANIAALLAEEDKALAGSSEKVRKSAHLLDGLRNRLNSSESALEDLRSRSREKLDLLNSFESKEEILKEMIENLAGFNNGVKLVMKAVKEGTLSGVIGIVADIMEPESGYESALEAALGRKAHAIVVETRGALNEALRFLEDKKAQAHFIVYEDIRNVSIRNRLRAIMRNFSAQSLKSFIKVGPSHSAISDFLLGDIYLTEGLEEAFRIYGRFRENVAFVTKDGFFIERGHVLGNFMKDEAGASIIGRAKKLERMRGRIKGLKETIEVLAANEAREKKGIESLAREVSSAEEEIKKEEICLANIRSRKESVESSFKKVTDEESLVELEISEVGELIHEITLKGDELNTRLNEKENEYARDQAFISSSQEAVQKKTKAKNGLILEVSEIKSELTFLANTETDITKNLNRETALSEELGLRRENRKNNIRDAEERKALLEAETKGLEEEIAVKKAEEAHTREGLNGVSGRKEALLKDLREKEATSREKEKRVEDLRNQIRSLEITKRESELTAVNITDKMRQDWEGIRNQAGVLKIKLEKLGPVNLVAIDEHKELEERYAFLTQQQEDLLRAKESLHKAIVTINKTTKKLFLETFQKIQLEFKNYFRMLFAGGHAELLLLDESDVLESGIEIIVRPPGKKLQNLLLLSGGEKALTAIALLFAIFKVKPSPFCILDEVDAPLDESNIGRFTKILQEFLRTSQFVVITHSKKTMQMANVLYGITMQEKGISKIVSVKFAEDEAAPPAESEEVLV
jgi:chromosome segregation protein